MQWQREHSTSQRNDNLNGANEGKETRHDSKTRAERETANGSPQLKVSPSGISISH